MASANSTDDENTSQTSIDEHKKPLTKHVEQDHSYCVNSFIHYECEHCKHPFTSFRNYEEHRDKGCNSNNPTRHPKQLDIWSQRECETLFDAIKKYSAEFFDRSRSECDLKSVWKKIIRYTESKGVYRKTTKMKIQWSKMKAHAIREFNMNRECGGEISSISERICYFLSTIKGYEYLGKYSDDVQSEVEEENAITTIVSDDHNTAVDPFLEVSHVKMEPQYENIEYNVVHSEVNIKEEITHEDRLFFDTGFIDEIMADKNVENFSASLPEVKRRRRRVTTVRKKDQPIKRVKRNALTINPVRQRKIRQAKKPINYCDLNNGGNDADIENSDLSFKEMPPLLLYSHATDKKIITSGILEVESNFSEDPLLCIDSEIMEAADESPKNPMPSLVSSPSRNPKKLLIDTEMDKTCLKRNSVKTQQETIKLNFVAADPPPLYFMGKRDSDNIATNSVVFNNDVNLKMDKEMPVLKINDCDIAANGEVELRKSMTEYEYSMWQLFKRKIDLSIQQECERHEKVMMVYNALLKKIADSTFNIKDILDLNLM